MKECYKGPEMVSEKSSLVSSFLPASQWQCVKTHCLSENQPHHLVTALCLSFVVCKMGALSLVQRIMMRIIEIKHSKYRAQRLERAGQLLATIWSDIFTIGMVTRISKEL